MKPITALSAVLLLAAQSSNAQFLNKLKQKAQSAVTNAVTGQSNNSSSNSTGSTENTSSGSSASPAWAKNKTAFNAEAYGQVACTLQADEHIIYGEHSLNVVNNQTNVKVITGQGRQYFLYENGKRSGPYNTPPVNKLDNWNRNPYSADNNSEKKSTDWQPYISRGILTVDGKSYGEFTTLSAFYHNKALKKFYAIGIRMEQGKMTTLLVTEKSTLKLPTAMANLIISDNGELGGVIINATQYNAKTDEEQYKVVLNDDVYVVLTNGTTIGPLKSVQADDAYLDNSGRFVQVSKSRKAVFVNGTQAATLPDDSYGDGKFYTGSSGQSGAWFERGSLYFTDGTRIVDYVMQPALSTENGKQVINWLTLQNHKLYVCKKDL